MITLGHRHSHRTAGGTLILHLSELILRDVQELVHDEQLAAIEGMPLPPSEPEAPPTPEPSTSDEE